MNEKKTEERVCKNCLHYVKCLKRFREYKEEGIYKRIDEEEYFAHANDCEFFIAGCREQIEAEWLVYREKRLFGSVYYICSRCGRRENHKEPYCNCGAKMKGCAE